MQIILNMQKSNEELQIKDTVISSQYKTSVNQKQVKAFEFLSWLYETQEMVTASQMIAKAVLP